MNRVLIDYSKWKLFISVLFLLVIGLVGCMSDESQTASPLLAQTSPPYTESLDTPAPPDAFPPSFMLHDTLFYSTGIAITTEVDESCYLGRIDSVGDLFKRPTANGQANISVLGAPYAEYEGGFVLLICDEWILFEAR